MNNDTFRRLRLDDIVEKDFPGVTKSQAGQHAEACLVCLDHHDHKTGVEFVVILGNNQEISFLHWENIIDDHTRRSWKDLQEATEYGAVAIALLLVIHYTEYTIIERAVKGTGFDYWLLENELYDEDEIMPSGSARLEVSGLLHAQKDSQIQSRIKEKEKQTNSSHETHLPAIIVIMEFSRPEAHMVYKL